MKQAASEHGCNLFFAHAKVKAEITASVGKLFTLR